MICLRVSGRQALAFEFGFISRLSPIFRGDPVAANEQSSTQLTTSALYPSAAPCDRYLNKTCPLGSSNKLYY